MIAPASERARETVKPLRRDLALDPVEPGASSDVIPFRQLFSMVFEHWLFVLGVGVAVFVAVMSLTLTSGMEFVSSGRLYLGELDSKGRPGAQANDLELSAGSEGQVASEIEILKSRTLVTQAVLKSGLNVAIAPAGQKPTRYWKWLVSGRDPELLDGAANELRAVNASLASRFREPRQYTARFTNEAEYELRDLDQKLAGRGKLDEPLKTNDLELTLTPGSSRRPKPGARYDLVVQPLDVVVNGVLVNLEVTAPKVVAAGELVNVVTLEYAASSPRLAAAFLDQLMQAYLKERQAWKTEDASAAEAFVSAQLAGMRQSLDQVQKKLADYRTNNRVVVLDNEAQAMIERIAKYEEERLAARLEVASLSDMKKSLSQSDAPMGAYLVGEAEDSVLREMSSSLTQARQKLTDLKSRFNDVAPNVREQQEQVDDQLQSISNYVSSRLRRSQEHLSALNGIIGQFEQRLRTVPGAEMGLAELSRESEVYSRTYSYLLERQQQAAIVKASRLSKNRVLDAPQVPLREDSPKLPLRLMSGLAGLLLGATVVVLRNLAVGTIQNRADLQRIVGARPILASIPRRPRRKRKGSAESEPELVLDSRVGDPGFRFAEAFRTLRANLMRILRGSEAGGKVVVITSPNPGDGKTTAATWLAAVLAADDRLVLCVDADLRRPKGPSPIDPDDRAFQQGLHGFLDGHGDWRDAIGRVPSRHGDYDRIIAGDGLKPEALSGERMSRFLREARQHYDFVLLDCPSYPFVADALVLANSADAVLSVFRLHHSSRELALEHTRGLSGLAPHGILINEAGIKERRSPAPPSRSRPSQTGTPPARKQPEQQTGTRSMRWAAAALAFALMTALLYESVVTDALSRIRPAFIDRFPTPATRGE